METENTELSIRTEDVSPPAVPHEALRSAAVHIIRKKLSKTGPHPWVVNKKTDFFVVRPPAKRSLKAASNARGHEAAYCRNSSTYLHLLLQFIDLSAIIAGMRKPVKVGNRE